MELKEQAEFLNLLHKLPEKTQKIIYLMTEGATFVAKNTKTETLTN